MMRVLLIDVMPWILCVVAVIAGGVVVQCLWRLLRAFEMIAKSLNRIGDCLADGNKSGPRKEDGSKSD